MLQCAAGYSGVQNEVYSKVCSGATNALTQKALAEATASFETQAGLTWCKRAVNSSPSTAWARQASFAACKEGQLAEDSVGGAICLQCNATSTRLHRSWSISLMQSSQTLKSKEMIPADRKDAALPGVGNMSVFPNQGLSLLATSAQPHTATRNRTHNRTQIPATAHTDAHTTAHATTHTHNYAPRLLACKQYGSIHWLAWLALAVGAVFVFSLISVAAYKFTDAKGEVHHSREAGAVTYVREGSRKLTSSKLLPASKSSLASSHRLTPLTVASGDSPVLCPDLVVPAICECVLRVDLKRAAFEAMAVKDSHGNPILRVSVRGSKARQAACPNEDRRVLLTTVEGFVLAQCVGSHQVDGEFHMFRADGELFGRVWQSEPRSYGAGGREREVYTLRSVVGAEWFFGACFSQEMIDITDAKGKLLAMLRPEPDGIEMPSQQSSDDKNVSWLRVASSTDVAIVLCGIFTITKLM